jgi:AraC-like DNA-binding protein/mannose-6-phosphate isomerase-like protein (cupin superfamily)
MICIPHEVRFEAFRISHLVDAKGRYSLELNPTFPLSINAFDFPCMEGYPLNWHERLEIFVPVEGQGQFRMGDKLVPFHAGDVLVVENMKLHGLAEFRGDSRKAVSISFLPELAYNPGSPICDLSLLIPFYACSTPEPRRLRNRDPMASRVHAAMNRLIQFYFGDRENTDHAGCHVHLLEMLYWLSRSFPLAGIEHEEYLRRQQRRRRLTKLFEYIQVHYADPIPVEQGAEMTAMSVSRFMRFFKEIAGMTFVSYLTHVRLTAAVDLLRHTELSIGEIASAAGFPDQSYFGRVFRNSFGTTPTKFRGAGKSGRVYRGAAQLSESSREFL